MPSAKITFLALALALAAVLPTAGCQKAGEEEAEKR